MNVHTQCAATNVAGQALIPVVVAARERILDKDAYDAATSSPVEPVEPGGDRAPQPVPATA